MTFTINTEHPLACGPDTLRPWGSRVSNARCPRWNQLVFELLAPNYCRPLNVIDLGCAGGGWVRDCIDWGHVAVGIDGSDWGKIHGNGEWRVIPDRLFTTDITKPFDLLHRGEPFKADLVTAFEVMEHIKEEDLPGVFANVSKHLKPGGLFVCSVNPYQDTHGGVDYHATVKPILWWETVCWQHGFFRMPNLEKYFAGHFLRGPKHPISGGPSLVLSPNHTEAPKAPKKGAVRWMLDHWLGSIPQRCIQYALCGPTNENR